MAFSLPRGGKAALTILTLLCALPACELPPGLTLDGGGQRPPGTVIDASFPETPVNAGSVDNPSKPANPSNGATVPPPPAGGSASCKMSDDGKQVCVVCVDAHGKVVRDGCYTKEPPAGGDCHEVKRPDGSLCTVCFDAAGQVAKSACRGLPPTPAIPPSPPTPPVPPAPATCSESKHADGTVCTTCVDAHGKILKQGCSTPMTPPAPDPVTCRDYEEKGAKCTVCHDAKGTVVKQGCWSPPSDPGPGTPAGTQCKEERHVNGGLCVTCYDEKGHIVRHGCSVPPGPPTPADGGAPPANGAGSSGQRAG